MIWAALAVICLCCLFKNKILEPPLYEERENMCIEAMVRSVEHRKNGFSLVAGDILIYLSESCVKEAGTVYPGSRIQASGTLNSFSIPGNPGQFDEYSYYKSKGISYILWAEEIRLLPGEAPAGKRAVFRLRERLREVYEKLLPEKEAKTLTAMVLGEKAELSAEIKETYQQSGIGHLLAISGLHISIAAMAVYQGIFLLKGSRRAAAFGGILSLFFYGALTGFSISASRAVIMLLLSLLAQIIGRSYDRENALAFSALWLLLEEPARLFQSSFLLSFGAVIGAGSVYPVLEKRYLKGRKWLRRAVVFQVAVSLVTLPAILWFTYEIPVYGMLLNIFLVPLMSLITGVGLLAGFVGLVSIPLARFLIGGVWFLLKLYEVVAKVSLALPFSLWNPGKPALWKVVFYAVCMVLVLAGLKKMEMRTQGRKSRREREKWLRRQLLASCIMVCLVLLLILPQKVNGLELTFLDVGQGDGAFLQCEEGISCLIDGGSSSEKQVGKYRILPFLKYKGKKQPDYIFVSHMDDDHINGVRELIEKGYGKCLVLPADLKEDEKAGKLVKEATDTGMEIWWIQAGEGIQKGKLSIRCLAPENIYTGDNENAASMVLLVEYGEFSDLFTGDLEKEGEAALLKKELPECDFLKVAHHGSDNATSEELLERIQPEIAIISCGQDNPYGHPGKELLQRLSNAGCQPYITSESGAVTICTDGKTWKIKKMCSSRKNIGNEKGNEQPA